MGLRLTRASDYAIRAVLYLGSIPDDGIALKDDIAAAQNVPASFMAKILGKLVRAGVLRSARGVSGGFALAKAPSEITTLDVVEAIEGPIQITDCVPDPEHCTLSHDCPMSTVWSEVQKRISELLGQTTIESLVSARRKDGRVVYTIQP